MSFQDLDLHFADRQTFIGKTCTSCKEQQRPASIRYTDGTIPKENLREIYKCLFQREFENSHEGRADIVLALRKVLFQSKLALTSSEGVNYQQQPNG